uniref:L-fucose dehydrogenase-like isoform X2 n=1 Tax=Pogona vitticeps TaxID=103695 RepID=A0ABM5EI31_9SAUR
MAGELRYACKVVIVTGGSRGIGEAILRKFGERGEALQKELEESGCPGEARFVVCDVASETDIKNLVSMTINLYGCLDCLVNNAGVHPAYQEIDDVSAQDFRRLLDINVIGYFLAAKTDSSQDRDRKWPSYGGSLLDNEYALPHLRKTKGNIINIASLVAIIGEANALAYVATKGAVTAMTKAMALDESKRGVRVNSISPGNIWTPLWQKLASEADDPQAKIQEGIDAQPLGRLGTPEEIALAVLFMACDATFCTGADLVISGGAELGYGKKNNRDAAKGVEGVKG